MLKRYYFEFFFKKIKGSKSKLLQVSQPPHKLLQTFLGQWNSKQLASAWTNWIVFILSHFFQSSKSETLEAKSYHLLRNFVSNPLSPLSSSVFKHSKWIPISPSHSESFFLSTTVSFFSHTWPPKLYHSIQSLSLVN